MKSILVMVGVVASMIAWPVPVDASPSFPGSIPLPTGFYPEGIAVGRGHDFYVGSLFGGAIYKGDLRTGQGQIFASAVQGRVVSGLKFDERSGLLWGVGFDATGSRAFVFNGRSGEQVAAIDIAGAFPRAFLNDLVVTRDAVYITDSVANVIWSIPLDNRGQPAGPAHAIPLSGDFTLVAGTNLNGIAATANGRQLVAVHSALGVLYRIDPSTGTATKIDLGGDAVPRGDGIVLHGKTLYVVQNFLNQVAVVSLDPQLAAGELTQRITSDRFRVPSTAALFGSSLYVVNARLDVAFPPFLGGTPRAIDYDVVQVPREGSA
jgi:sugar lactone lactonase YvrE